MDFEKNCVKLVKLNSNCQPQKCSAWTLHIVSGDIRFMQNSRGSPNFYENFRQTFLYLSRYVVLISPKILEIAVLYMGHSRLDGKRRVVPKSSGYCGN